MSVDCLQGCAHAMADRLSGGSKVKREKEEIF